MSAGKYSFTIEQGATLDFEIQYKDSNGNPIDLTGYTGAMQISSNYSGSGTTYLTFTSSLADLTPAKTSGSVFLCFAGSTQTKPTTSGSIGIYAGWAATDALTFTDQAYYDLEITSGSIRTRILEGRVSLSKQVTY